METRDKITGRFIKGISASPSTQFKKGEHWRKPRPHWDKEWLEQQYLKTGRSVEDIANEVGCTPKAIYFWIKKHGIVTPSMSEIRKIKYWGSPGESNGMFGMKGNKNGNWRGGVTPLRQSLYSSLDWVTAVKAVWKRDKYKCRCCDQKTEKGIRLHIHHIKSFASYPELRTEPSNLVLLCPECHHKAHSNKRELPLYEQGK